MSQQLGPTNQMNQPPTNQQPTNQQPMMQSGGTLPRQTRTALHEVAQAIQVCGWCADQCIQSADPNMIECIRLCEDVSELGETALTLIPRNSRHAHQHLQTLQQALQACAQECGQHHHAHCQECAQVLPQTAQSIQQYVGASQ
jgi:Cys-tRNA synthase (O-phospho-L-seryl-tRNA:Cys-tRNA synthase)